MSPNADRNLLRISKRMAETRNLDKLLEYIMQEVVELTKAESGYLIIYNRQGTLEIRAKHNPNKKGLLISYSIINDVVNQGKPLLIADALNDERIRSKSSQIFQLRSVMCVPLESQNRTLGFIYVENQTQADVFDEDALETLIFFANQTAIYIDNAILTDDLQHSRKAIVLSREEERQRIHRDLHDGLGPLLGAISLHVDALRMMNAEDADQLDDMIKTIQQQVSHALSEIRRITYHLRPPALERLGLENAIKQEISLYQQVSKVHFEINITETLPVLTPAHEVAIYRIISEAVLNVIKHARATLCHISIQSVSDEMMQISIRDNGCGLPAKVHYGVGLHSMRDRAEELGGQFILRQSEYGGVQVDILYPYTNGNL